MGDSIVVTATASSGLDVAFTTATPTTCSVGATTVVGGDSQATVTILAAGTCTVTASQSSGTDGTWNPAPSVSQTITATQATAIVTLACRPARSSTRAPRSRPATAADSDGQPLTIDITYNTRLHRARRGPYAVVATVNDPRYQGQTTATITILPATLTVSRTHHRRPRIAAARLHRQGDRLPEPRIGGDRG